MKADLFQKECIFFYSVNEKGKYPKSNLPEIAFLGRSNVGKSSLINSLVNRKNLVRTSNSPGSTIKINYFIFNIYYFSFVITTMNRSSTDVYRIQVIHYNTTHPFCKAKLTGFFHILHRYVHIFKKLT